MPTKSAVFILLGVIIVAVAIDLSLTYYTISHMNEKFTTEILKD